MKIAIAVCLMMSLSAVSFAGACCSAKKGATTSKDGKSTATVTAKK